MFSAALRVPLPRYRDLSPSRSSTASCSPVEAPLGTAARPMLPSARYTSASTVGFPRESRISLPAMRTIVVNNLLLVFLRGSGHHRDAAFCNREADSAVGLFIE